MKVRLGCPTCGETWRGSRPRISRGRIVRLLASGSSVRVNWPIRRIRGAHGWKTVAYCPDPYHVHRRGHAPPEVYAGLNRHAEPEVLGSRKKAKARRHRERQGKGRR